MTDPCCIFLHLPKTAGTTVRRVMRSKYASEMLIVGDRFTAPPDEIADELTPESTRRARVVVGHIPYGVHEHIPRECQYMTVLREPVARVVSLYYFIERTPGGHPLRRRMLDSQMSLAEFVDFAPDARNHQTRLLAGIGHDESSADGELHEVDDRALAQAKRNLERFAVVGLTERFDESFILIRRALGWKLPWYIRVNAASEPKPVEAAELDVIRERNQLDLELYEFAERLFSEAVASQPPSFAHEVRAFRAFNKVPNTVNSFAPVGLRRRMKLVLPR